MSFTNGEKLGGYEILGPLGAGGMGEVYRARDTKLGREVAIKVLPEEFAEHPEKLARFEREARLLAALNHPKIATLYGVEEAKGQPLLIMELVEGETLADRIARGPIPTDEALAITLQIAEALEAAHEKGVIHRDLKPANIKVDPEGSVKILDFGLAKAFADDEGGESELSQSPTLSRDATRAGVILGTAAYMSPEQAKGKAVDKRSDIFSFGVVLYEMLTGKKAFEGEDVPEVLAAIINKDPDWDVVQPRDSRIQNLLRRCLRKDRKSRRQSIGDVRVEIQEILSQPADVSAPLPGRPQSRERLAWLGMAVFVAATLGLAWVHFRETPPEPQPVQFSFSPPPDVSRFSSVQFAISPDGRSLVFVNLPRRTLGVRSLESLDVRILTGTDSAAHPFWSPDSEFIGYFVGNELKRVRVSGGPSETISDIPLNRAGGTWNHDDVILIGSDEGIVRVDARGGQPSAVTVVDEADGETAHQHPQFLPDGNHFLFLVRKPEEGQGIYVGSLGSSETKRLLTSDLNSQYAPPGYLLTMDQGVLWAHPFDVTSHELSGSPVPVVEDVRFNEGNGRGGFYASTNGVLAYHGGDRAQVEGGRLVWVSRDRGDVTPIVDGPIEYPRNLRLSPDGERLALITRERLDSGLWVYPLDGRPQIPLTFQGRDAFPVWSPDGTRIAFASTRDGAPKLFWMPADGSTLEPRVVSAPLSHFTYPGAWSTDGNELIIATRTGVSGEYGDILAVEIDGEGEPKVVVGSEYGGAQPRLSPDGKWLAFRSNLSGRDEIWVRSYPAGGAPIRVTSNGGTEPVWSRDGRELFYIEGGLGNPNSRLMAIPVETSPEFRFEQPRAIVDGGFLTYAFPNSEGMYDVAPDGRFVMVEPYAARETNAQPQVDELTVVINWVEALSRRGPAN